MSSNLLIILVAIAFVLLLVVLLGAPCGIRGGDGR